MAKPIPIYCIDSCYFIDWIQETPESESEVVAMSQLLDEMNAGKCQVVMSAAVVAEVLPGRRGERYDNFSKLLRGGVPNFVIHPLDVPIAQMVAQLREDLAFGRTPRRTVDAIHLATAIYTEAQYLYTRDSVLIQLNDRIEKLQRNKPVDGFEIREFEKNRRIRKQKLPFESSE